MFVAMVPPQKIYVMQGIPGSGKSTVARMLQEQAMAQKPSHVTYSSVILSTDEYWGDRYEFDPAKLGDAHAWNQRRCVEAMLPKTNYIFIDNTNILKEQAAPYFALASMYGYEAIVVRVDVPLDLAQSRNKRRAYNRRVPEAKIKEMYEKMERLV